MHWNSPGRACWSPARPDSSDLTWWSAFCAKVRRWWASIRSRTTTRVRLKRPTSPSPWPTVDTPSWRPTSTRLATQTGDDGVTRLEELVRDCSRVYHLAAQAGVRASWGQSFRVYAENNVLATQLVLEACRESAVEKVIYASSSSVYGDSPTLPLHEDAVCRPISPYGVTKLAGEHLAQLYWTCRGVPTVSLRFFTVYGPRQRPDMAFNIFIRALLAGEPLRRVRRRWADARLHVRRGHRRGSARRGGGAARQRSERRRAGPASRFWQALDTLGDVAGSDGGHPGRGESRPATCATRGPT